MTQTACLRSSSVKSSTLNKTSLGEWAISRPAIRWCLGVWFFMFVLIAGFVCFGIFADQSETKCRNDEQTLPKHKNACCLLALVMNKFPCHNQTPTKCIVPFLRLCGAFKARNNSQLSYEQNNYVNDKLITICSKRFTTASVYPLSNRKRKRDNLEPFWCSQMPRFAIPNKSQHVDIFSFFNYSKGAKQMNLFDVK